MLGNRALLWRYTSLHEALAAYVTLRPRNIDHTRVPQKSSSVGWAQMNCWVGMADTGAFSWHGVGRAWWTRYVPLAHLAFCPVNHFIVPQLQLELDRIPTRNLGRDDRIISSHGKETRHPFLSLSVVSFLAGLPVHLKLDPRLDIGIGDKVLLRLAARKVGLVEASIRKKRAMQFGSHSARMEGGDVDRRGDSMIN